MVPRHAHAHAAKPLSAACQRHSLSTGNNKNNASQCWATSFGVCFIYVFFRHVFLLLSLSPFCFCLAMAKPSMGPSRPVGGTRVGLTRKTLASIKIVNNRKTIIKPNCASIEASCVYRSVETSRRSKSPKAQYAHRHTHTKWPNCSFSLLALQPWRQPRPSSCSSCSV